MNKSKLIAAVFALLLGGVVSANAAQVLTQKQQGQLIDKLEMLRGQSVEITAPVLQKTLDEIAPESHFVCNSGAQLMQCENPGQSVFYKKGEQAHVLTVSEHGQPMDEKHNVYVGGLAEDYIVFPRPCKVNGIRCQDIGTELAFLERDFEMGSEEYVQAVEKLFGDDLEDWTKLRDGGSRQYRFKNGIIARHYVGIFAKGQPWYGDIGIEFFDNKKQQWSNEIKVDQNGQLVEKEEK